MMLCVVERYKLWRMMQCSCRCCIVLRCKIVSTYRRIHKKVLKSYDFRTFSFVLTLKCWTIFLRKPADPYPDPYHDSLQWTRQHQRPFSGHQVPRNRETIGKVPVKFSSLKLCKPNNFALGTVIRQYPGPYWLKNTTSCAGGSKKL